MMNIKQTLFSVLISGLAACAGVLAANVDRQTSLFPAAQFSQHDALLVVREDDQEVYQWRAEQAMVPASLTKLATTYLAIEKWGLEHHFSTEFWQLDNTLWVKGFGDPYVISEEFDLIAAELMDKGIGAATVNAIAIDNHYFEIAKVPGRSGVADPYNAPLSAVAANFNTVKLSRTKQGLLSAESQTPLTNTARRLASSMRSKSERVNLVNAANAQRHFAEILSYKLGLNKVDIIIDQTLPEHAQLLYRHHNSRPLKDYLKGALEFSNNFIANQLFLKLAEGNQTSGLNFSQASEYANQQLKDNLGLQGANIVEGSGLSRRNRLSARQVDTLLQSISPHADLLKRIDVNDDSIVVHAKTGTLDGVRSYAGYISLPNTAYRFVFLFNRKVPYRYRDKLLADLIAQLRAPT